MCIRDRDFSFSVYSARARLSIQDPSLSIVKGVRLVFYKKGEARASYRKMFYTPGEITMEPLKPDTTYEVEGYFDYIHPQYGKQREVFLERTVCGKTLPVSALKPIKLHVEADGTAIEPNSIQLREFQLMDLTAARASSSNAEGQISAVPYISSVQMEFEKKGTPVWNAPSTSLGSTLVNQLKQGKAILWKTSDILDSDSQYRYRITFYDRYGNEDVYKRQALSIAEEYMLQGVDVLVVLDDLKRHANIHREMSLLTDKAPSREAYPADIFYTHSRLLEKGCQHKNGGSITILPIVEKMCIRDRSWRKAAGS